MQLTKPPSAIDTSTYKEAARRVHFIAESLATGNNNDQKGSSLAQILVIDDDPLILEIVQSILAPVGHQVAVAENGLMAMKVFRPDEHRLVITDVCMPYIDGVDLLRVLRREAPQVPVIVITGHESIEKGTGKESTLELANKLGAVRFLHKPFTSQALLESVKESLRPV